MKKTAPRLTARTADRHDLYEQSVQNPESDIAFLDRVFRKAYGRPPVSLREDFCGTAALCRDWVKRGKERTAEGVDLDGEVLEWGRAKNIEPLGEEAARVTLVQANVLDAVRPKTEVRVGFNFSYFVFQERAALLRYFRTARRSLKDEGIFAIDLLGGPDAQTVLEEPVAHEGFDYVWEQAAFNPIDHHYLCHIHFDFPDGSRMRKAFTYDWRLWTMMELRDLLAEAGFSRSDVYWEGTDRKTNEGNGVFTRRAKVVNEDCWIAYVVALP